LDSALGVVVKDEVENGSTRFLFVRFLFAIAQYFIQSL
jgi:hypothetical protein